MLYYFDKIWLLNYDLNLSSMDKKSLNISFSKVYNILDAAILQ